MDSITHTLMGLTIYGATNKKDLSKNTKNSILFATVAGSNIPDLDIVFQLTEKGRIMYQMWHRGISHSLLMAPMFALLIYLICYLIFKTSDRKILYMALLSILIHISFDALNTWGTGLFEPFTNTRVSLGIIPIVDFVIWFIMLSGFVFTKIKKTYPAYRAWNFVWLFIFIHVVIQSVQGIIIYQESKQNYEISALSADFIPGKFSVIGKNGNVVEIYQKTIWTDKLNLQTLYSREEVDLKPLFENNPKAKVLYDWSPFVVIEDDDNKLAIYDPRFYRDGSSFLYEYMNKK